MLFRSLISRFSRRCTGPFTLSWVRERLSRQAVGRHEPRLQPHRPFQGLLVSLL